MEKLALILEIKKSLELFYDYHDTALSSSEFLKKYNLSVDALDNAFLRAEASLAIHKLESL